MQLRSETPLSVAEMQSDIIQVGADNRKHYAWAHMAVRKAAMEVPQTAR